MNARNEKKFKKKVCLCLLLSDEPFDDKSIRSPKRYLLECYETHPETVFLFFSTRQSAVCAIYYVSSFFSFSSGNRVEIFICRYRRTPIPVIIVAASPFSRFLSCFSTGIVPWIIIFAAVTCSLSFRFRISVIRTLVSGLHFFRNITQCAILVN